MEHTKEKITELFSYAVELFNDTMGEEYSVGDNGIMLRFFTPDNGIEVYEKFCSTYFPIHLNEDYRYREKFENMAAEAFVSDGHMGVMLRIDLTFPEAELLQIYAHEIAHIYCTLNEIKGESFYTKYCDAPDHPVYGENVSTQMNGFVNAGYAIWREAIADIISVEATCDVIPYQFTKKMVSDAYEQVQYGNPYAKRAASNMITYAMFQRME